MTNTTIEGTAMINTTSLPGHNFQGDPGSFPKVELMTSNMILIFSLLNIGIFIIGIIGNILTILVIASRKAMRRSIHYYTFNLCICDLTILLFFVPTQITTINDDLRWTNGINLCRVSYGVIPTGLVTTIATLLCISIDRAYGLLKPFKWRSSSRKSAKILITGTWTLSIILNLPLFFVIRLLPFGDGTFFCGEKWNPDYWHFYYWLASFILTYAIPLVCIFILQLVLVYTIKFKVKNRTFKKQNQRMANMTVAIVLVFTFCSGMQHIMFFLSHFKVEMDKDTYLIVHCTGNLLVVLQAGINPFIYGKFRGDFSRGYKNMFRKLKPLCKRLFVAEHKNGLINVVITPPSSESLHVSPDSEIGSSMLQIPIHRNYQYMINGKTIFPKKNGLTEFRRKTQRIISRQQKNKNQRLSVNKALVDSKELPRNTKLFEDMKVFLDVSNKTRCPFTRELLNDTKETEILC